MRSIITSHARRSYVSRARHLHVASRPRDPTPRRPAVVKQSQTGLFTSSRAQTEKKSKKFTSIPLATLAGLLCIWSLYPTEEFEKLTEAHNHRQKKLQLVQEQKQKKKAAEEEDAKDGSLAWLNFSSSFEALSLSADIEWAALSDKIVGFILPEWSKLIPGYVRKLQRELSLAPGSLAGEIWAEAHDPFVNPEVRYSAAVRVSSELCKEEKEFLSRRRKITRVALARYLDLKEEDVNPDDVPVIAMCGSGGGMRAMIAGAGSLLSADEDGLFDCVTYTAGVSGSCWLQTLYFSAVGGRSLPGVLNHLKSRASIHIAYPPVAFQSLVSAPTNKYLLSGFVEKLRGDPNATFGLVDAYGLLLAARFLVPKGELGVDGRDFKLSNQRDYIKYGQNPMPIYTAVRHEIPGLDDDSIPDESAKTVAKKEAWFQWFEVTPYEFFCEEFSAGIPTWALGRRFNNGVDVPLERGFHLPEVGVPFLMGVFGSAFCATLSHYYREIRPLVQSIAGFASLDDVISGRNDDLSKVHPIDPGTVANFAHGMHGKLPDTVPKGIYDQEYIQLMDAGMSNNLPIYPLLRPGRGVEILVAFDASADIKTENWLAVADGYARQRGIKGWPVGIGWPKESETPQQINRELEEAEAHSIKEADDKLKEAKLEQQAENNSNSNTSGSRAPEVADLGYCTVWVGTTQERETQDPPPTAISDETNWQLMEPDAGIAVVYLPFIPNEEKVPGLNPATTDFLSTWNFVYTPEQIDSVVALARANYDAGRQQLRATVRAVYERKKKLREEREAQASRERYRGRMRKGIATRLGEGDHFS
ncbi:cytosolic phospholipase A2 zeta [Plectosphaerella plurivora]|uniref:Lysophospholipase n=1 Tax=Plectosphaerella plurivora TaxID=936078 RepID=A0A9P8VBG0_9PEZI|nr:cytosolic phospholipase A2 zeta [Plectosphaerella plurivora]